MRPHSHRDTIVAEIAASRHPRSVERGNSCVSLHPALCQGGHMLNGILLKGLRGGVHETDIKDFNQGQRFTTGLQNNYENGGHGHVYMEAGHATV